jgi:hypothetical protein
MATGSSLTIQNVVVAGHASGLWDNVRTPAGAYEMDGSITVSNCTVVGENANTNNWASQFAFWATANNITYGENYQFTASNNCFVVAGSKPLVILDADSAGDTRWAFKNNRLGEGEFKEATTSYANLAAFEAAHAPAADNTTADPLLTSTYRPKALSPLLGAGTHLGYTRDIEGKQRPNPPSIGAYDTATLREV